MIAHYYPEIPRPADPDKLPRDTYQRAVAGRYVVAKCPDRTDGWGYFERDSGDCLGRGFRSEADALNDGALRDEYRRQG